MDAGFALSHSDHPTVLTAEVAILPGAATPLVIPLAWLPPATRARFLLADTRAPLGARVGAALDANLPDAAWAVLRSRVEPIAGDLRLERTLDNWAAAEGLRLGLPGGQRSELYLGVADGGVVAAPNEVALGLGDVRAVLAGIGWPRWRGPLLAVAADDQVRLGAGVARLARPALPVVRLASERPGRTRREAVAAAALALALDLSAPPDAGWPPWLRVGLGEVVMAIARGEGPSPRAMHDRRRQAGEARIAGLLSAAQPDPALAMAVCAPLAHSNRRHLLPNLLDPLRHGADSAAALRIAYAFTPATLVAER